MIKDKMKNKISMALKDPILQQGFECICKENAELKEKLKPENCLKLLAKGGYVKFTNDQLPEAKEIIRKCMGEMVFHDCEYTDAYKMAEAFVNKE